MIAIKFVSLFLKAANTLQRLSGYSILEGWGRLGIQIMLICLCMPVKSALIMNMHHYISERIVTNRDLASFN